MTTTAPSDGDRDTLLLTLQALSCDPGSQESFAQFVQKRAELLQALDGIVGPWTQAQKALLQQALVTGAQILAEAQVHRQQLARRIEHLRSVKKTHQGYGASAPARIRKLF